MKDLLVQESLFWLVKVVIAVKRGLLSVGFADSSFDIGEEFLPISGVRAVLSYLEAHIDGLLLGLDVCNEVALEVHLRIPCLQHERKAELTGRVILERVLDGKTLAHSTQVSLSTHVDGDKVLERFAHLQPLNVQVAGMQEVVDPLLAAVVRLCTVSRVDL